MFLIYLGMTRKSYRPWSPEQPFLLPPSPADWLPEDHLALFVLRVVERLDLSAVEAPIQAKDPRGERPYAPQMLTGLLLYGYCTGALSSRQIERATYESVPFRVLAGGCHPDHATIARFRRGHHKALQGLFVQVLGLCAELGVLRMDLTALDGTKVLANASKHKAMSYDRMGDKKSRLEQEVADLLAAAEATDEAEDAAQGDDNQLLRRVPDELARREKQIVAIEAAMRRLEEEARSLRLDELEKLATVNEAKSKDLERSSKQRKQDTTRARKQREQAKALRAKGRSDDDNGDAPPSAGGGAPSLFPEHGRRPDDEDNDAPSSDTPPLPEHRVRYTAEGSPHAKAQANFTDSDSRIMEHQGGFVQAYNCQSVVNEDQLIVGQAVTNQAADTHHLPGVVDLVQRATGRYPSKLLADAGYWSPANAAYAKDNGIDVYISIGRESYSALDPPDEEPVEPQPPPQTARDAMKHKLRTDAGSELYRRRKAIVEPVFGQMKTVQRLDRFMLRSLELVRAEWSLACTCHNLMKLWRMRALPAR